MVTIKMSVFKVAIKVDSKKKVYQNFQRAGFWMKTDLERWNMKPETEWQGYDNSQVLACTS